jgi:hypothetical protein
MSPSGAGSDTTAVHTDVSGEINGVTEKTDPVGEDYVLIEDSEDSNNKKKAQISNFIGESGSQWNYLDDTAPAGYASGFEVLYQFDGSANSLTDRMGNGHDLTAVAGTVFYTRAHGMVGLLFPTGLYFSAPKSADYRTAGAMTWEMTYIWNGPTAAEDVIFAIGGLTNAANDNTLFQLSVLQNTGQYKIFTEHGAGVNDPVNFDNAPVVGTIQHLAITRAADGITYTLLVDGDALATAVNANQPTDGSNSQIWVGGKTGGDYFGCIFSMRYSLGQMSEAQVAESYQRVRGIIA